MRARAKDRIAAGREALTRAAWAEARSFFEEALAAQETESIEALEGLGVAARWQMDGAAALAAHERAYALARAESDEVAAARLAIELTFDAGQFRGAAEMNGWLERAGQLLERLPPQPEHAVLAYWRANRALNGEHDPAEARRLAAEGVESAVIAGAHEYEMICRALEGLALVAGGDVREGMRLLDAAAAAAVAGEVISVRIVEVICCHLIDACQRVRDVERAGEWCLRVEDISRRYADAEMFATCRTHYADLLVWQGQWREAEETLSAACRDLGGVPRKVLDGVVRLAELRRRQGRPDQAEALLAEAEGHRLALLVSAALHLDRGDASRAAEEAERYLRRVGMADRFERAPALELLVRASLAVGEHTRADEAAGELERTAADGGTAPLRAAALLARGRVAAETAPATARSALEDAVDLYVACGARYEAAQARLDLADVPHTLRRDTDAEAAVSLARSALAALGAPRPASSPERALLTAREREVLWSSAVDQARLVRSGEISARELVGASLRAIDRLNPRMNAFVAVCGERALAEAGAIQAGDPRPLCGVPVGIKDLLSATAGPPTSEGSSAFGDWVADHDSAHVRRLREAGAIVVGKTNTPELGLRPVTENLRFGATRNPWDPRLSAGGSSGGSAAAVASGMIALADGSDLGGSIRIPASCCGLVGLKASLGRVSIGPDFGDLAAGMPVDGVLTRTVMDTAVALDAIAGHEPGDRHGAPAPRQSFAEAARTPPARLDVRLCLTAPLGIPVDDAPAAAASLAAEALAGLGHDVREAAPDWQDESFSSDWATYLTGVAQHLLRVVERLHGRPVDPAALEPATRQWLLDAEPLRLVEHLEAGERLWAFARRIARAWRQDEILVTPTLTRLPADVSAIRSRTGVTDDAMRFSALVRPWNVTGQPALSLPLHATPGGIPVGVQLVGPPGRDDLVIAVAAQLEASLGVQPAARPYLPEKPGQPATP